MIYQRQSLYMLGEALYGKKEAILTSWQVPYSSIDMPLPVGLAAKTKALHLLHCHWSP